MAYAPDVVSGGLTYPYLGVSGIIISSRFDQQGYYESQQQLKPELDSFRQAPDPIKEMEQAKEQIDQILRAEKLLKEVLGEGRYKDFLITGIYTIGSKRHPDQYYIVREYGRVEIVEHGVTIDELCIVPTEAIATQDVLILRKFMLEADEELFLKTAVHYPRYPKFNASNKFMSRLAERFNIR
jgi:hypothetical protein